MSSAVDEPPAPAQADAIAEARLIVRSFIRERNLPGLSVAAGLGGRIVWAEGFGWADIDTRRPVTPATRFRIGGVAMPITAAAVGLLLERGELDIDLPVRGYVPEYPEQSWPVTTRQLMGHVAGIRHPDDEEMLYRRRTCRLATESLPDYAEDRLRFESGTAYLYSSYGWSLVGAVVERAAGQPFLEFIRREVLEPLSMQNTVFDDPEEPVLDTTSFYWPFAARDTTTGIEHANNPNDTCLQGAGALLSTPSDLARFGMAMLDGRLLRAETLELMQSPMRLASGESTGHGLGWSVQEVGLGPEARATAAYGHEATAAGGTASLLTIPEYGIVIALTANVSHARDLSLLAARLAGLLVAKAPSN